MVLISRVYGSSSSSNCCNWYIETSECVSSHNDSSIAAHPTIKTCFKNIDCFLANHSSSVLHDLKRNFHDVFAWKFIYFN